MEKEELIHWHRSLQKPQEITIIQGRNNLLKKEYFNFKLP